MGNQALFLFLHLFVTPVSCSSMKNRIYRTNTPLSTHIHEGPSKLTQLRKDGHVAQTKIHPFAEQS